MGRGSPGDVVVLEGAGFDVGTPANNVVQFTSLGGSTVTAPVLAAGGTQLHVRIPDTAAQGNVTVTVGATTSNPITYRKRRKIERGFSMGLWANVAAGTAKTGFRAARRAIVRAANAV